jgi:hypothetical protein
VFRFFVRRASGAVLLGARAYCSASASYKVQVRTFAAYALTSVMRISNRWPSEGEPLRTVLQDIQDHTNPEGLRMLAENFTIKADTGKKVGSKAVMYGFGIVGNWLMNAALMRESGRGRGAEVVYRHREFLADLFDGYEHLLTSETLDRLQSEWPQLR